MATPQSSKSAPGKLLGDAGEHYALSQFSFAGKYAAKMPDNWEAYDLAVETGHGLVRASVKTRSESKGWKNGSWFMFDERKKCDWLVLIFKQDNSVRSWVIPFDIALQNANTPGPSRKDPWMRDISWAKLNRSPLKQYENNWALERPEQNDRLIASFEGGSVYVAERDGQFLVIINQAALLDLLDEDDRNDSDAIKVLSFPTAASRLEYIIERGWPASAL